MRHFCLYSLLLATVSLSAELKINPKGDFQLGGLPARIKCFNEKWQGVMQTGKWFHVRKRNAMELEADISAPTLGSGTLKQKFTATGKNSYRYEVEIEFPENLKIPQVALDMTVPTEQFAGTELEIDGKKLLLPVTVREKDPFNLFWGKCRSVVFPLAESKITIRGDFIFLVQDDRAGNWNTFAIRALCRQDPKRKNRYSLSLDFSEEKHEHKTLDLRPAFTTGFVDKISDDRQGGWTDQGADNDLRMLPCGKTTAFQGVPFEIVAPWKNGNKSCIVLRGPFRGYFPQSASAEQKNPVAGNYLYLLHAMAWPSGKKIGEINIEYTDGDRSVIPVTGGKDVGNWWQPGRCENGLVVWTGENKAAYVGLYRSAFPIRNKPVRRIGFSSTGASVWAIVAATVSSHRIPEKQIGGPVYIREGADWKPICHEKDVRPGSVLDFSANLDAPAGKYGPVVIRNGHFEFRDRPGKPVRFYGTNLVDTAQYLTHEWSEKLADRMVREGFNIIRIHHHDNGLSVRKNGTSTELNPENLDRLNYLIACLKKRGIYVITDCYVSRTFTPEEEKEWGVKSGFKNLVFLRKSAMENWKRFVKNWFTAKNPYTGLALNEDPVLIAVNLINEGNPGTSWNGVTRDLHMQAFREYLAEHGRKDSETEHNRLFAAYILDRYGKGFSEMKSYLRNELGMTVPISDQNHRSELLSCVMRNAYDYVDNHYYFDHPTYPVRAWHLPAKIENVSALSRECSDLAYMCHTRIFGKPMTITEYDYAKPNFYRAEGAVLTGAYAGLQDWDALVQFAYSHGYGNVMLDQVGGPFDLGSDVVKSLSHRIGVKLFLGNEIKPAPDAVALAVTGTENMDFSMIPSRDVRRLGLLVRTGLLVLPETEKEVPVPLRALLDAGINFPSHLTQYPVVKADGNGSDPISDLQKKGILAKDSYSARERIFRASGGQLEINGKKETFRASADGIEVLILPAKQSGKSGLMSVKNRIGRGVFSLQSVDSLPLRESKRMLFLHLTDSQATMLKFDNPLMKQHSTWGKLPHLAARGEADVTLSLPDGEYTLYSCDTAGKRLAEIPLKRLDGGTIGFPAKVFRPEGQIFVYELVRK